MAFPDFPFPDDLPSFVGHEEVRSYLIDYAQHFKLLQFIKVSVLRHNASQTIPLFPTYALNGLYDR